MLRTLSQIAEGASFDVVVVGAGGAGMVAALLAATRGLKVLLIEHTRHVGGTTATSAMLPSPAAIPAVVENHTVPSASRTAPGLASMHSALTIPSDAPNSRDGSAERRPSANASILYASPAFWIDRMCYWSPTPIFWIRCPALRKTY